MTMLFYRPGRPQPEEFSRFSLVYFGKPGSRRARREQRDYSRTLRAWRLALTRDERRLLRLDPPMDYDDPLRDCPF
jgi:hypothetical protein